MNFETGEISERSDVIDLHDIEFGAKSKALDILDTHHCFWPSTPRKGCSYVNVDELLRQFRNVHKYDDDTENISGSWVEVPLGKEDLFETHLKLLDILPKRLQPAETIMYEDQQHKLHMSLPVVNNPDAPTYFKARYFPYAPWEAAEP